MDLRTDDAAVDWTALEHHLQQRACWYDDPDAYRQGVRDALAAVRRGRTDGAAPRPVAVAG